MGEEQNLSLTACMNSKNSDSKKQLSTTPFISKGSSQSSRTGTDFTADSPPDANLPFIQVWDQLLAAHRLVTPDGFVSAP